MAYVVVPAIFCPWAAFAAPHAWGQIKIDQPPIDYFQAEMHDAVADLQRRLDQGQASLRWDEQFGWLPALLEAFKISPTSQTLVFSKTSLQISHIAPETPRALYFNDDVYVGSVQHGDLIEVSAVDPQRGAVFYSLPQRKTARVQFTRDQGQCLTCHQAQRTQGVPGYLVRSLFTAPSGQPLLNLGGENVDATTPFVKRFGGWYVTGEHGTMRHRGNAPAPADLASPRDFDVEAGANVVDLTARLDTSFYLTPHSDLVAQMTLEHQTQMHNAITLAAFTALDAQRYDAMWNKILDRPEDHVSEVSQRRLADACENLVRHLLFCNEYRLDAPISGSSQFAADFPEQGPRDSQGRSLRDFDLQRRLFKHPCSYLIYCDSIASLPSSMKSLLYLRLHEVLAGDDASRAYSHLSADDRLAIREILNDTHPTFREASSQANGSAP
ncbi:MAG: hypothetical protein KDA61_14700 [Planctomycetales bacterium]|nr:hypothetical protein [Planctomycetales bacterium]